MNKIDIKSLNMSEIKNIVINMNEKPFRAKQIFSWLHQNNASSFSQMHNIPNSLIQMLDDKCDFYGATIQQKFISKLDNTTKYLFEVQKNNIIESVLMKYEYGNAVCISSQVGCRMGCTFCASTLDGLERNLTAGEMLSQIYEIQKDIGERISSIVIMGSGEPLDNFDNVLKFIELVSSPDGINIGQRHITLSTCGIVDKIYELADKKLQITLAISLHAPNDDIRRSTMPVAKKYDIDSVIKAAKYYAQKTKRRVTFEYALISGLNDSTLCAEQLANKIKGSLFHVNLIPINNVEERGYVRSSNINIKNFARILQSFNIETTIRRKLGSDINAACGQLRRSYKNS